MIKVLLVDDHDVVRCGIERIVNDAQNLKVVGACVNGEEAIAWFRSNDADVVLMDMQMPGLSGLETMNKLLRVNPDLKVIFLSAYAETPSPTRALKAGAYGFLTKDCAPELVIQSIYQVYSGQRYLAPELAQSLALSQVNDTDNPFEQLSDREMQIAKYIVDGVKVSDISEYLTLSPKTVNSYRYRIFEKLDVAGDVGLTRAALRYGLIDKNNL